LKRYYTPAQIRRVRSALRKRGINVTCEQVKTILELESEFIPRVSGRHPRGEYDLVETVAYKDGRRYVLHEARKPEVFNAVRKKRKRKWKPVLKLPMRMGTFTIMESLKDGNKLLAYDGGGHHDWFVMNPLYVTMIVAALKRKGERGKGGRSRVTSNVTSNALLVTPCSKRRSREKGGEKVLQGV
jgi:DNA-binding transcriptional MerR regulator